MTEGEFRAGGRPAKSADGAGSAVSVLLGLGANLGERRRNIERALERLEADPQVKLVAPSRLRATDPVGGPPQGRYVNGVAEICTTLLPEALLELCHAVEADVGRVRTPEAERWGPRPIDVDILFYGDEEIALAHLGGPHPRMLERQFVLEPLAELAPQRIHPVTRKTVAEHWSQLRRGTR